MKLIKPSFEIIPQSSGLEGIYKQIELAGRTCYKSEANITEDSAKEFVERMIKSGHGAMLEHGTVYLQYNHNSLHPYEGSNLYEKYKSNKYSECHYDYINRDTKATIITTNYRVLFENNWLDDLKYLCEPTEFHEKRITVRFIMDRIGSQSFCRHRVFSFAQESTRFCNYSKEQFGDEITYISPCWFNSEKQLDISLEARDLVGDSHSEFLWKISMINSEAMYKSLLSKGWSAQQARSVLPNSLKTELIMTGFVSDWKHFFSLRATNAGAKGPHPQAAELANPLYEEFIKLKLI